MRYRLNKTTVIKVLEEIEEELEYLTNRGCSVEPINQLLITLRFLATGSYQIVLGDTMGVDKSTICRIINKVIPCLASLTTKYIKFPPTEAERQNTMKKFYVETGFPGVLGAIDCTHVPIQNPGGQNAERFRNRKGWFSLNVQLICEPSLLITDCVARWPGSTHDSTIFDFSNINYLFVTKQINKGYLIGDGGYRCTSAMLTPIENPRTEAESKYNTCHIQTRNCIERTNGVLKRRLAALQNVLKINVARVLATIVAAVVLHNIAITLKDDEPPEDVSPLQYFDSLNSDDVLNESGYFLPRNNEDSSVRSKLVEGHFTY